MDQAATQETGIGMPTPSFEMPEIGGLSGIPARASRTLAALVRLHRVTGPRKVRVVLDPETVSDLEPYCTVSPAGRPALGGWELIASPDASADQVTLYDAAGGWVIGAFAPQREVGEPGSRIYEGLRRAGYAIPDALSMSGEMGPPMDPGSQPGGGPRQPNPSGPFAGGSDKTEESSSSWVRSAMTDIKETTADGANNVPQ